VPGSWQRQRGFTLIEVVVAFAIFAMSVGALYEVFSAATRRSIQARDHELLELAAQSLLSELRVQPVPWPVDRTGTTSSGEQWRMTVAPFDAGADERSPWRAYEVTVYVSSPRVPRREAALKSIELARTPE